MGAQLAAHRQRKRPDDDCTDHGEEDGVGVPPVMQQVSQLAHAK